MASIDYTFIYTFSSGTPATGGVLINQATEPYTLTDIDADPNDGSVAVGDFFRLTGPSGTTDYELLGLTADGDPIFSTGTNFFVLSNTNYPDTQLGEGGFAIAATNSGSLTVCFAAGTLIRTPKGEARVEDLGIGDLVSTADGNTVPVKWIGRQTLQKLFAGERARPVRVSPGALGNGLPHTDLVLTADHALILDGLAINAGALVNGTTITLEPLSAVADRVTYYHVETENHDVILANGAPAETYVDYVGRRAFDNHAEYVALYGEALTIAEMPLPRISAARLVPLSLKARLAGVAAA